jgi:micrococcal nuclease
MKNFNLTQLFFLFNVVILFSCNGSKSGKYSSTNKLNNDLVKVISIDDGDTFDILINNKTVKIRMDAIDAPEKGMPFWRTSKEYLSKMIFNKQIKIKILSKDNNGRSIARTYLKDSTDVSAEMIKAGYAWHYKKYNNEKTLSDLEESARQNKLGLWVDKNPYNPEYIRKLHKKGISTKDTFFTNEGM